MNKKQLIEDLKTIFESYRGTDWGMAAEKIGDKVLETLNDYDPTVEVSYSELVGDWFVADEEGVIEDGFATYKGALTWAESNGYKVNKTF